jgi:hypothetical protein
MTAFKLADEASTLANGDDPLLRAAFAIGVGTAASGVALMIAPRLVLRVLGARRDEPAPYLFRIVGMFMAVAGGSLVDISRSQPAPRPMRWAIMSKVGAAAAVTGAISTKRFGKQAWLLVAVDSASAALLIAIARRR